MPQLVVAGTTIPVAPGQARRDREDGIDRSRALDKTMRATQIGTAKRTWNFSTTPITRTDADTYEAGPLAAVGLQTVSGDLIGGTLSLFVEITGWEPVKISTGHRVILSFSLHEP